jgi:tetratricopeptide (TPR) repeat protein
MNKLLSENQAALKLGITKELLFSYVRTGVKGRKLEVIAGKREIKFKEFDLDEFESFLKENWVKDPKEKRPSIPKFIKEFLKVESNGQCARCASGHRMDDAHIIPWSDSFSHFHHNLIRLCTDCHIKYDDGIIPRDEIIKIKKNLTDKLKRTLLSEENLTVDSLRTLPNPELSFIGREDYIKKIHFAINEEKFIVLSGIGGIGKTELLIKSLKGFKQQVKWFKTEKFDSIQDLKIEILNEFNVSSISDLINVLDGTNLILVLDGLERLLKTDGDETLTFLENLNRYTTKVKFIITSQINLDTLTFKVKTIKIKGLSESEAKLLLKNTLPDFKISDLNWVIKFSNGHVLTIKLLVSLISFYKNSNKVKDKLKEKGAKFINSPLRKEQNTKTSLSYSLKLCYEALNSSEQLILAFLTNFPIGCKEYTLEIFNKYKLVDGAFIDDIDFIIAKLNQFNLIEKECDPFNQIRITVPNPIKQFVISEAMTKSLKIWHKLKIEAFNNLMFEAIVIFQQTFQTDRWEDTIWRYEVELPNYLNAIKRSVHSAYCKDCKKNANENDYLTIITGFASVLYKYLFTRGHIQYGLKINEESAKAHMKLGQYDFAIDDLTMVAQLYYRNNDFKNAEKILEQMRFCNSQIKDSDKSVHLYLIEGELIKEYQPEKAIYLFNKGLEILSKSKELDFKNSNTAIFNSEIGRVYENSLKDYEKALEHYKVASDIYYDIKDYSNQYSCLFHIGNCYSDKQDFELSLEYYKNSLKGFINTGQKEYIGNSLAELGRLRVNNPTLDYSFIDENIVKSGLYDIKKEIELSLNTRLSDNLNYKLWYIIQLFSFSNNLELIEDWANQLLIKINEDVIHSYPWFFLKIAILTNQIDKEININDDLKSIKHHCYLYGGEVEHDKYAPFNWLALWLDYKGIENTTRGKLFSEVENFE